MLTFQIGSTNNSSNNNNNNNNNNNQNDCHNIFFQIRFFLKTNYSLKFTNFLNIFQQFHDENILFETTYIFYWLHKNLLISVYLFFLQNLKHDARIAVSILFCILRNYHSRHEISGSWHMASKGDVVFAGGWEIKIFSTVFRDFWKIWSGNGIFNTRRCR